jgi:homogentisate 1,2-dioxygenase
MTLIYQTGFGNEFATEARVGALPIGRNSPQRPELGLYAEQITGTAFTAPRHLNQRTWVYRIHPAVKQKPFKPYTKAKIQSAPFDHDDVSPNQLRWSATPPSKKALDFIDSIETIAGNGSQDTAMGCAVHTYNATASMVDKYFYNADGELLIVPQEGALLFDTELGQLELTPGEIIVIPRGIRFRVTLSQSNARGYICENYGSSFTLPDLGPIGANGLANSRDFKYPVARYEDNETSSQLIAKFSGRLWVAELDHSPLDIVAWHGNYAPYKYDLNNFNTINTVSFDHCDPSIFTVLTSPSTQTGTANIDFAIFPPRWMVAENTFRPPWFHRNAMSEFMGLIYGIYDGKEGGGFEPGGYSLHNCMSGHGPDNATTEKAMNADLKPHHIEGSLAFMFESRFILRPTKEALKSSALQKDYYQSWMGIKKLFK